METFLCVCGCESGLHGDLRDLQGHLDNPVVKTFGVAGVEEQQEKDVLA